VKRKIRKVLIANRGEIAVRIIRTLRALGIRSVAAHSDADALSLPARMADEAVRIGPAPASESYLRVDAIVSAALASGADAVHPGYGFLSERVELARAVEEAGLAYIGPTPGNVERLGSKLNARAVCREHGLPSVPGSDGSVARGDLSRVAREVGLPLLFKAAAGGGGKGIRIVRKAGEIEEAYDAASSEARASFGSSELIAERYLERARHVEVQVVGDGRGGVRVFTERDCSTQRRQQKLLEETPSPALSSSAREKLLDAVARMASAERYRGAGTFELLLSEEGTFHFLEVNTRLQVEHPITEAISGIDLVALQIEVAEGKDLEPWGPGKLDRVALLADKACAMEFRINAEDPLEDFRPSTGTVTRLHLPAGPGIRVDTALEPGTAVTPYYDSLLAKVIAWGPDRDAAIRRLRAALVELDLGGVATTAPLGVALLDDRGFLAGENHIQYLAERLRDPEFLVRSPEGDELLFAAAAAARLRGRPVRAAPAKQGHETSPWVLVERLRLPDGGRAGSDWGNHP